MKSVKRIQALFLCVLMLCSTLLFAGCKKEPDPAGSDEITYKVTVVDGCGQPYTEKVIVKFMSNGEQAAMAAVDGNGVVEKTLAKGDYTVELMTTTDGVVCYYDTASATLTADKTELQLTMAYHAGEETKAIYANSLSTGESISYDACYVSTGSTYVTLEEGDRNYFLFTPTEAGVYEISVNGGAQLGYYGAPSFVQSQTVEEVTDGKFTITVSASMIGNGETGTTVLVIGLDPDEGTAGTILNIVRTGDPAWSIEQEPWTNYQPTMEITQYTLPEGTVLKEFDLTASTDTYNLVLNEEDGCYHLNSADGPLVFVQLEKEVYGISMKAMVGEIVYQDGVLMQSGVTSFRYSYNNGQDDFFKEDYTDALRQYVTYRDAGTGVYPLTKDLYYILPMGMENIGWCKEGSMNYLFESVPNVNNEISWLFLCCYEDVGTAVSGDTDNSGSSDNTSGSGSNSGSSGNTSGSGSNSSSSGNSSGSGSNSGSSSNTSGSGSNSGSSSNSSGSGSNSGSSGNSSGSSSNGGSSNNSSGSSNNSGSSNSSSGSSNSSTTKPIEDNKSNPNEIAGTLEFEAEVKSNHIVYYSVYHITGTTLKINSKDAYVIYNGKTYEAKNGVVTVTNLKSADNWTPVSIAIGNKGTSDATFTVKLSYPSGTQMNPKTLSLGSFTTETAKGNSQGVYYTWTATKAGTFTIKLDSVTSGVEAGITVNRVRGEDNVTQFTLDEFDGNLVSVEVEAGDKIEIIIGAKPNANFEYPAATITATASFK